MSLFGRNDQAVTANSTTTAESTTGAPLGTYTAVKGSGNGVAPISMGANAHFGNTSSGSRASVDLAMFNNTTPGAFITNMAVGVFGVSQTEEANNITNKSSEHPAHAGWNLRRAGTGPIINFTTSGGTLTGYNNADIITVKSPQAGGNATITFTTNTTGGSLAFTIANSGAGFNLVTVPASNIFVTNATGGTATGNATATYFVATAGGRAGRVHYETLVATGTLGVNTTTATGATGLATTVTDATTDNTQFPGV